MIERPRVENAPGITWRRKGDGWEAIWRARADLVERGFRPKNQPLWSGLEPSPTEKAAMSDTCRRLQDEMLMFSRGGLPVVMNAYDGTIKTLAEAYQTNAYSPFLKRRYAVRKTTTQTLRRIVERHGHEELSSIKGTMLIDWHKEWSDNGNKLPMGRAIVAHLRSLFSFGAGILEDPDCERLCGVLHRLRFAGPPPRTERLTAEQAVAICGAAHVHFGWPSIALAQALQFELMLRQKDVIGEWVPQSEPGISDVHHGIMKWISGLRWSSVNENLIVKHVTSKRQKMLEIDLRLAPMVISELKLLGYDGARASLPSTGPIIICDTTGLPFTQAEFCRKWRKVATQAGVPKAVRNMDTRAGAISEATDAGAELEHVRHAATHSDIAMTQRYSRGSEDKIAQVQRMRIEGRNKPKKDG